MQAEYAANLDRAKRYVAKSCRDDLTVRYPEMLELLEREIFSDEERQEIRGDVDRLIKSTKDTLGRLEAQGY